jgi:signal transduction histidine kinase
MVILLGTADYFTSVEYSFAIFYLLPITFVTWFTSKRYGLVFAIISSLAWLNADMQAVARYMNPTAPYWNAVVRFGLFLVVVYLLSMLKKMEDTLEQKVESKTRDLVKEIDERKKTEEELKNKSEKLSELAKRIQNIKDEENTKIAREIHDELGQSMTAVKIDLMWLSKRFSANSDIVESLHSITATVDDAIKNIREISSSLRPKLLDALGFTPAVERYLKDFETKTGICYKLNYSENNIKFNLEESNALFRILQEALTNIARHSDASVVEVAFSNDSEKNFLMTIRDDGIGLPKNYSVKKETLGIIGMKERAESIGGQLEISSPDNEGTVINVKLPKANL